MEQNLNRWRNRRWMTWVTLLCSTIMFPAIAFLNTGLLDMAPAFYTFSASVVGVYIGFATADDVWQGISKENFDVLSKRRWKNRRWMTWITLLSAIVYYPALCFYEPLMMGMVEAFYIFSTTVVGAYIGFSTAESKWQRNT